MLRHFNPNALRLRAGASLYLALSAGMIVALGPQAANGQIATSLINEGAEVDSNALPGVLVTDANNVAVNSIGGWTAFLRCTNSLDLIWGSVDGVTPPSVLRTEGMVKEYLQISFEGRYGMSDTGSLCYGTTNQIPPDTTTYDSVYVDTNGWAIRGQQITTGPLAGLYWAFASGPTMTANGIGYFSGGTNTTGGTSATARGLWAGESETPVIYTGYELFGLPAPIDAGNTIDFSYKVSRFGTEYIVDVFVETTGTGVPSTQDSCLVKSGQGLFLDGQLVQEGMPVPPAIGGIDGEAWTSTSFDFKGVNDMGGFLFTGDTSHATNDEILVLNGQIHLREGDVLGPYTLTGSVEAAEMNNSGDWALIWQVSPGGTALIFNDQVVLVTGDLVDLNGDGVIDAGDGGATVDDFEVFTNAMALGDRDAAGNVSIYLPLDVDVDGIGPNTTLVEGVYRITLSTTPGPAGDLELMVTDSPDPQTIVPGDITYTVKVRNNSGAAIDNVVVTSVLDPGLTFNAGLSDPIAIHAAGTVTASLGTMAANEVRTYKFVATAAVAGMYTTTTSVAGDTPDTVPGNNNAVNETEVGKSTDLSVTITDVPDPLTVPGGEITYTIDVYNDGPSDARGIVVTMNLDPTTTFNPGLSDPAAIHNLGVVTINVGALAEDTGASYDIVVNVTVQGVISVDASITGNEGDPIPDNNTDAEDTLFQLQTDLSLTISDAPDPVLPAGGQITYLVTVDNAGPSDATGVTASVTLDDSVSVASVDPPGVHDGSPTGGVVTYNLGSVPAGSNGLSATIVVDTFAPGRPVCYGSTAGGGFETDPAAANNSALVNTLVIDSARGLPIGVFSNILTSPTSDVPGLPGAKFGTGPDKPYRSPDGKLWIISADTDLGTAVDEVIIVGDICTSSVVVQEGVTPVGMSDLVGFIDTELSINNAGQFAFATDGPGATASDEMILRWDGSQIIEIAREGNISPATGGNYGSILGAANIVADNTVWFDADTTLATTMDRFILSKNGVIINVQEGVTFPLGQAGGATNPWQVFNTGALRVDATGANYLLVGDTDADSSMDGLLAVNNMVQVQEGVIIPGSGFASPALVSSSTEALMFANGSWMARGSNGDGTDWALRDGSVIARTGDSLVPGGVEQYSDNTFSAGFFTFAQNSAGDYIVGSLTTSSELVQNAVLVLNGAKIIAREDDPIDLDGNGLVDDGIRIHTFGNDDLILTEDLQAYLVGTVRDFNHGGSPTDIGDVYVRINLCGVAGPCGDLDNDKDVDGDDFDAFVLAFGKGRCDADYHICADFDEDGLVTQVDYQQWLLCYREYVGNPLAAAPTTIMGDHDRDNDVDLADFAEFQACAGESTSSVPCRARFDFNADGLITAEDATGFGQMLVGP